MAELALELEGVTKRFGALVANDAIDFELRRGEIHALLGENGAGKSTLMNVLYGLLSPDEGQIRLGGEPVTIASPRDAIARGIGMVHQHFMLVGVMTVAENLVLASEPRRGGLLLDVRAAEARTRELSERFGLAVDPRARVEDLGVGAQQRVEILRALFRGAQVLVLDEPTAVLTAQEASELFRVLRALAADGTSIVLISHKLGEVLSVADRVTVLRRGRRIDTVDAAGADRAQPGAADGRPRRPPGRREGAADAGRADARGDRPARGRRPRPARAARGLAGGAGGGDRRRRGGRRQRPERADRGDHRAAGAERRHGAGRRARARGRRGAPDRSTRAWGTSPRTATAAASCSSSTWPRTCACATTARRSSRGRAGCRRGAWPDAPARCSRSTTSAAATPRPARPRCRAATSRRS